MLPRTIEKPINSPINAIQLKEQNGINNQKKKKETKNKSINNSLSSSWENCLHWALKELRSIYRRASFIDC